MVTKVNAQEKEYDKTMKSVAVDILEAMGKLDCTTDGIQIHVNRGSRWVAKYETRDGKIFYYDDKNLLGAIMGLLMFPEEGPIERAMRSCARP